MAQSGLQGEDSEPGPVRLPGDRDRVAYAPEVLADAGAVTVLARALVVPAVFRGSSLREPRPALFTEQLGVRAGVAVEFEFEFGTEGSLAVPAGMRHTLVSRRIPHNNTGIKCVNA